MDAASVAASAAEGVRLAATRKYDAWDGDKALVGECKQHDYDILTGAKAKARTDLELGEWRQAKYYLRPECLAEPPVQRPCPRVHTRDLSVTQFIDRYERPNLPVMIDGIVEEWPANKEWTAQALYNEYRHIQFRCGEDDDGYSVKVKLKYFLRYMATQTDDSPLYIFDSHFDGSKKAATILGQYSVPKYFTDDLFQLVGEKKRPPYRWVLVGPKRSGTAPHTDPLATSAWNALVRGRKRWVLFPPDTPKRLIKEKTYQLPSEDDEPIDYFTNILPRIKERCPEVDIYDFVQYPGETIFVPSGWWHAVMNLDDTIAVTQNFCSRTNFDMCWRSCRKGRARMANKFLRMLDEHHPDLAARARELNKTDDWTMKPKKGKNDDGHTTSSTSDDSSSTCSTCASRERKEKAAKAAAEDAGAGIEVETLTAEQARAAGKKKKKSKSRMGGGAGEAGDAGRPALRTRGGAPAGAGAGAGAGSAAPAGDVEMSADDAVRL